MRNLPFSVVVVVVFNSGSYEYKVLCFTYNVS